MRPGARVRLRLEQPQLEVDATVAWRREGRPDTAACTGLRFETGDAAALEPLRRMVRALLEARS